MDFIYVGKLVNTHALKGEVRLISDFEYKNKLFIKGMHLYIGEDMECVTIETYRKHKSFDMCKFIEYNYINDVLKFKGKKVYALRSELNLDKNELLLTDYLKKRCIYKNKTIGYVEDVIDNNGNRLLLVNSKYIPLNPNFIENIDLEIKKGECFKHSLYFFA